MGNTRDTQTRETDKTRKRDKHVENVGETEARGASHGQLIYGPLLGYTLIESGRPSLRNNKAVCML